MYPRLVEKIANNLAFLAANAQRSNLVNLIVGGKRILTFTVSIVYFYRNEIFTTNQMKNI